MEDFSFVGNAEPEFIEGLYEDYLRNPESVEPGWRTFFEGFEFARKSFDGHAAPVPEQFAKEAKVFNLILGYRRRGHLFTKTNPVRVRRNYPDPLTLESFGLAEADLDTIFQAGNEVGLGPASLRDIVALLDQTYCHSVAVEYTYMREPQVVNWLQTRMESTRNTHRFTNDERLHILRKLTEAVVLEKFMLARFVGQKTFSIEGVDTVIPALDALVEKGADLGIEEFVIGTSHRGRLNILGNVLDKNFEQIFAEFEGRALGDGGYAGDVKYHLGHATDKLTRTGKRVRLSTGPNPSHLESVDGVTEGMVRARIDHRYRHDLNKIVPVLIHGDAAIAAQGVVYEVLQMSLLEGYRTGGTVHIVLNNQVGFTTNYLDGRSSTYCTDVGKVTLSPVFHVNGDDVEAVVYTVGLALEYRQQFHRDVFMDILGYRKHGHNEGDEPRFTQPILYKAIAQHPNPMEIYRHQLVEAGVIPVETGSKIEEDVRRAYDEKYEASKVAVIGPDLSFVESASRGLRRATPDDFVSSPKTGVKLEDLKRMAERVNFLPSGPKFFSKIQKILDDRRKAVAQNRLDWAMGELLAYGTVLDEGLPVRLTGQDSERGTFSHRHAVVKIEDSEEEYVPLAHVRDGQGRFSVYNSPLSEYGVMGFEYGYDAMLPRGLTIWEAQYGDFANGAQVIVDQFLCCGEEKWGQMSGLVLFLPHGYEGQGPEHSSARLERYLSLCANFNLQVANCTTPANFFHLLRRQALRDFRKPLIVMTPKVLLRHPKCVSTFEDFATDTAFQEVIDDASVKPAGVTRVILCSGKIYYDLLERRETSSRNDLAIVRLEQIYPTPEKQLEALTRKYASAKRWLWVQEEPANMGAWPYMHCHFGLRPLEGISRQESGTTATGFGELHRKEQQEILDRALEA